MQFSLATVTTLLLLPLGILASPAPMADVADTVSVPDDVELEVRDTSPGEIFKRSLLCKIVGSESTVHCRSGPGTGYASIATVRKGSSYSFSCYSSGTCVFGNCTWDRIFWDGKSCYVSGYYTDSRCTTSALGKC